MNYFPFRYSTKTTCEIELWSENPPAKIGQMTLDEALEKYIKPGVLLIRKNDFVKGMEPRSPDQYVLVQLNTGKLTVDIEIALNGRGAKQIFLHTWANRDYCKRLLERAYHMLVKGLPVEIHVGEKSKGSINFSSDTRLFNDLVHLRPEVIQRAMPERSGIIIDPQTTKKTYKEFCWVVGPPEKVAGGGSLRPKNITRRLYKTRTSQLKIEEHTKKQAQ
ncbi:hypothetical protein MMC08_008571 [Hypocenomyce scalaris]|nr:hypothetical protein [Hypocenomyce scalaris]